MSSEIFRPKITFLYFGGACVLAALWLWSEILTSEIIAVVATALWAGAILIGIYLIILRPKIIFTDHYLEIINPVQRVRIGWNDITSLGAKWALRVESRHGAFTAWAAPAPSRFHTKKIDRSELRFMRIAHEESINAAHSPKSESGAALHIAQLRWANNRGAGSEFEVERRFGFVVALAVLMSAAIFFSVIAS